MSKSNRTFLILTVILVILAALLVGLKLFNSSQEEKKAEEEEAAQIHITDIVNLTHISYNNGSEDIDVQKVNGNWVLAEDPEVALQQSYFTTLESEVSSLTADREIEEPDDLKDYGLDKPAYTIKASDEEDNGIIIYVGNGADSEYYLTTGDKEKVYTGGSALVSSIQYEIGEMIVNDAVPSIGTEKIVKASIHSSGEKTVYTGDDDEDALATILGGLSALSFSDCVNYHVTNKELAGYGLDKDHRITLKVTYNKAADETENSEKEADLEPQVFTLYIGNADDTGTYRYVQVKGSKIVNKALVDTVNNLLNK